jgi:hypothetical protein
MRFCGATAFENLGSFKDPRNGRRIGAYGIYSDARNNLHLLVFSAGKHRQDRCGGKPPAPSSGPARDVMHDGVPTFSGCRK